MKKFTLLLTLMAFSYFIVAQQVAVKRTLPNYDKTKVIKHDPLKDGGDIVWDEDFADFASGFPEGWVNVDMSDNNMPWFYSTDSVFGAFTKGFIESETAHNGFMVMNADGYNTVPQFDPNGIESPNLVDVDAYFQTPSIDLSAMTSGVILEFHHQYRYYTDMWYGVEVSADYDPDNPTVAHWSSYQANTKIGIGDPPLDEIFQINISTVATGQNNVVIRWYAHSSDAYFWCVDDVKIIEPFVNNMILTDSWSFYAWETDPPTGSAHTPGYLQHGGFYTQIPKGQEEPFVGFRGAVQNFGIGDQTTVVMTTDISYAESDTVDKTVVYTVATEPKDLEAAEIDSLVIDADYTPTDYGYYDIDMTVTMDATDELVDDNNDHWEFILNDSTYTRVTNDINSSVATRNWIGGGMDGDALGVHFTVLQTIEVEALKWQFHSGNNDWVDLILGGGYAYVCKIFAFNAVEDDWQVSPLVSSNLGNIDTSQIGGWITTDFVQDGTAEYLVPGDYVMAIETYTGVDNGEDGSVGFYFGEDLSVPQPEVTLHLWLEGSWGWSLGNPSFKLIVAADNWTGNDGIQDGVEETILKKKEEVFTLSQNYPNPAVDMTEINYYVLQNSNISFEIFDVTGKLIYSAEEGYKLTGKYKINLDVSRYEAGIYYYSVSTGTYKSTRKMVVMK